MTSRETTALRALPEAHEHQPSSLSDTIYRLTFGAIGWPWLLRSLWGGTKKSKRELLHRLELPEDALPNLGSWKADTYFLHRIVDAVKELRPEVVVELGAGASTLVCAKALQMHGGGRLFSYDQHAPFVSATRQWLADFDVNATIIHAPLTDKVKNWPGIWYDLKDVPAKIDLLIIDGPPWAVHPYVRGAAECLFDRMSDGGVILLDDAARPGERIVASRWKKRWPQFTFTRLSGGTKGTLHARKRTGKVLAFPERAPTSGGAWRRAAAAAALFAMGWAGHDAFGNFSSSAQAASFIDEADASYSASLLRQTMRSQLESQNFDRVEIARSTGLRLPAVPQGWRVLDVQVFPSDLGNSVTVVFDTERNERVVLYVQRAETPAEVTPLFEQREKRTLAYWEAGPVAYALTSELDQQRVLMLASRIAAGT